MGAHSLARDSWPFSAPASGAVIMDDVCARDRLAVLPEIDVCGVHRKKSRSPQDKIPVHPVAKEYPPSPIMSPMSPAHVFAS